MKAELTASRSRVVLVDYVKAIGIFLVVLGHMYSPNIPQPIARQMIYYFHMPLFFFLSGCFHRDVGIRDNFIKAFKALIVPAIVWNLAWWIDWRIHHLSESVYLHGLLYGLTRERCMPCDVTWFLFACFYCKIMMGFLENKYTRWFMVALWCVAFACIKQYRFAYVGSAVMAFPFYVAGYFCFKNRMIFGRIYDALKFPLKVALFAVGFILLWSAPPWFGNTSLFARVFGAGILPGSVAVMVTYALGMAGIGITVVVAKALSVMRIPLIEFVGMNTLVIMCAHKYLLSLVSVEMPRFGLVGLLCRLPIAVAVTLACAGLAYVLRRLHLTVFYGMR